MNTPVILNTYIVLQFYPILKSSCGQSNQSLTEEMKGNHGNAYTNRYWNSELYTIIKTDSNKCYTIHKLHIYTNYL